MRSIRSNLSVWLLPLVIVLLVASFTSAQNETNPSESETLQNLIDERRSQLSERLKNLRNTQQSLGENHPSAERVRLQIAGTEQEIENLQKRESLLEMGDRDLRMLVLQLALQVDRLENEVETLKQRIPRRPGGARALGRGRGPR